MLSLLFLLIRAFTFDSVAETRSRPNEGTIRSAKLGLLVCVTIAVLKAVADHFLSPTTWALADGLLVGSIAAWFMGWAFTAKHVALRLLLWLTGSAPLGYVAFLGHAQELLFLRQVGGGYIFTHRLLREHFACMGHTETESEPSGNAIAAAPV
jgi:xanthine/uracil permease